MTGAPIPYDPSKAALFHPESRPPVEDFGQDWTLDQRCAELSRLAYVRFEKSAQARAAFERDLSEAGFGETESFDDGLTGTQAFGTVAADGTVFVAFRGTQADSWRDMTADARFLPRRVPGLGLVHGGFWQAYDGKRGDGVRSRIDAWLEGLPDRDLVVTGHSLGAALATFMAALHPKALLVTFGSPRVGTGAFAARFAGRPVRRYVDCCDGVTIVPPPIGYAHIGELRYIDRHGILRDRAPGPADQLYDRTAARLSYLARHALKKDNVFWRSLADHAPINYVSAILGRRPPS